MSHTVYISEYLNKIKRGKPVFNELKKLAKEGKIDLKEIPLNKNEWCRDYMPVRGSDGRYTLFRYMPSYHIGYPTYESTIPDQKEILRAINLTYEDASEIILDGGAIEIFGTT